MKTDVITITCDLCNAPESSEIRFGVMGSDYGIDLCETHMEQFKTVLGVYVTAGHKIKPIIHSVRRDKPKAIATPIQKAVAHNKASKARRNKAKQIVETNGEGIAQ